MSIITFLFNLIIRPLQLVFEIIYGISHRVTGNPGLSIIVLSLVMNILVLPLYMRADKMQEEERDKEAHMCDDLKHIRSFFKGDEKMMMLQSYYRHVGYHQMDAFKGSVSLLLEIPFFIAAYHFLSHLEILKGVSFGPIADLGSPDSLLMIGGIAVNVLPFIMTGVNLISSYIFSKGYPVKTRVQLYAMALFFLVFLYNSPSGLVFYWTLNNIFSLIKTIFYKLKSPARILSYISTAAGIILMVVGVFFYDRSQTRRRILVIALGIALLSAGLCFIFGIFRAVMKKQENVRNNPDDIVLYGFFLFILMGILIPSAVIASSAMEFIGLANTFNPVHYLLFSGTIAAGFYILWMNVFYRIAGNEVKPIFETVIFISCVTALVDYMFFGTDFGVISNVLRFEEARMYTVREMLINLGVLAVVCLCLVLLRKKFPGFIKGAVAAAVLGLMFMSVKNIVHINRVYDSYKDQSVSYGDSKDMVFPFSRTGKNVVVIMMDRAMNSFSPYIFNEKPELKDRFSGFTYYANTASFGRSTNFGLPPIYGGYEYTPVEMNRRKNEKLEDKHNEALKVMPVLFDKNGYDVTVCEPVYAGYSWIPDLSIYDDYPDIRTYITDDKFLDRETALAYIKADERNFFCYSIMKTVPCCLMKTFYNSGFYNDCSGYVLGLGQDMTGLSTAHGIRSSFLSQYSMLSALSDMTEISDDGKNTFLIMSNTATHEPMLLQEPEYIPAMDVDNTEYDEAHSDRFSLNGRTLSMTNESQIILYHANMAAMIKLGEWFDYLKKMNVYDNTRIIIVADHGYNIGQPDMYFCEGSAETDLDSFYPLLMVKDFDAKGFDTSEEFMTNADVPSLSVKGLIDDPVNPFTGKEINDSEKHAHDQFVIDSQDWSPDENNGDQFRPGDWYSVHDDMRNKANWKLITQNAVYTGE